MSKLVLTSLVTLVKGHTYKLARNLFLHFTLYHLSFLDMGACIKLFIQTLALKLFCFLFISSFSMLLFRDCLGKSYLGSFCLFQQILH